MSDIELPEIESLDTPFKKRVAIAAALLVLVGGLLALGASHVRHDHDPSDDYVVLTDPEGNVIVWESAGSAGFKGSRKSTPFAAQVTADAAARKGMEHGLQKVEVFVKGPGSGRETAIRSLQAAGLEILGVRDVSPQAHNGVRPKKRRRV